MIEVSGTTPTHSERIRRELEADIVAGRLLPGDRLDEHSLAVRFDVSRTPIREALHQLSASGFIEVRPRRGAVVRQLGVRDLLEVLEVLAELEGLCARMAVRRMSDEDRADLARLHAVCVQAVDLDADDDTYYEANRAFHDLIRRAAGNAVLRHATHALYLRATPYGRHNLRSRERRRRSMEDHERIVRAVLDGDEAAAMDAMRYHVAVQADMVAGYFAGQG